MNRQFSEPILPEEYIGDFLLKAAEEVDAFRRFQRDYLLFLEHRNSWDRLLRRMGQPAMEAYEDEVLPAFLDYQAALENYQIARQLVDTILRRVREAGGAEDGVPGLGEAEERLRRVCRRFTESLSKEQQTACSGYLTAWKEQIDAGGPLRCQCGAELAEGLLEQAGF